MTNSLSRFLERERLFLGLKLVYSAYFWTIRMISVVFEVIES